MFSKRTLLIAGVLFALAVNVLILVVSTRRGAAHTPPAGRAVLPVLGPVQQVSSSLMRHVATVWERYFHLVEIRDQNVKLRKTLGEVLERNNQCQEIELSNQRLRSFLNFQKNISDPVVAAEIIAKDPSPWYKTITINKGFEDGVSRGLPVVVPEGVVGQVVDCSSGYSKVLLVVDQNGSVDALVQRNRARGVIRGDGFRACTLQYALKKDDLAAGDILISSGMDGIYPKGLRIGRVEAVIRENTGIFQNVTVVPFVDFEKIEEVMVILRFVSEGPEAPAE